MTKYIVKQKAISALINEANTHTNPVKRAYTRATALIEQITAEDVQPVKFARWIDLDNRILCSGCGAGYDDSDEVKWNTYIFCPNCGARMEVIQNE